MNRRLALLMLEKLGYRAEFAVNGRAVLEALEDRTFDVILMDCQMPELDGLAATRAIRAAESAGGAGCPLHIIAMTANAMSGDREACLAAGMNDYISKPVRMDVLRDTLLAVARQRAGSAGTTPGAPSGPGPSPSAELVDRGLRALEDEFGPEAALELLDSFLRDTPERLAELSRPDALADPGGMARGAHSLAGSAGIFGLDALRHHGLEIEDLLRAGQTSGVPGHVEVLRRSFAELLPELNRVRERLRAGR